MNTRITRPVILLITLGLAACAVSTEETPEGASTATETDDLSNGRVQYQGCKVGQIAQLDRAIHIGRAVAASPAFFSCVNNAMNARKRLPYPNDVPAYAGPYVPGMVYENPHREDVALPEGAPPASRPFYVIADAKSLANRLTIKCADLCPNVASNCAAADAWRLTAVGPNETMGLTISSILDAQWNTGANHTAEYANTIWHEIMHNRGYQHGGWGSDQESNVPQIVGKCMDYVVYASDVYCKGASDDITKACTGGTSSKISLISEYGSTSCSCVTDPGWTLAPIKKLPRF